MKWLTTIAGRLFVIISVVMNAALLFVFFVVFNSLNRGQTQLDVLAISITVLEIFLAVVAIGGFWLIRDAAISRARDTAREISEGLAANAAQDWLNENAQPLVHRSVNAILDKDRNRDPETEQELENLADALGDEGESGVEDVD